MRPDAARRWDVPVLGGAAGTGKTRLACRIARELRVGVAAVDDFQAVLTRMTTPEQQPALHFWRTHPGAGSLSPEAIQRQGLDIDVMLPALEAVVENHLEEGAPTVLEGDVIHPALAARGDFGGQANGGRVRGVFPLELDEGQVVRNFLERAPATGPQTTRARVSVLRAAWLRDRCAELGVPAIPARPWDTLLGRALAAAGR